MNGRTLHHRLASQALPRNRLLALTSHLADGIALASTLALIVVLTVGADVLLL
jgi:hypothetical protein